MSVHRTIKGIRMQLDAPKEDYVTIDSRGRYLLCSVSVDVECFICGKQIPPESRCWRGFNPDGPGEVYAHIPCGEKYAYVEANASD